MADLSPTLSMLWDDLERLARARIDETGLLYPIGLVARDNRQLSAVLPFDPMRTKGLEASALVRLTQEAVRGSHAEKPIIMGGVIFGASLVPVEGGSEIAALVGWLEEAPSLAAHVVRRGVIQPDRIALGGREVITRRPVLLTRDDAMTNPDIGRGRIGQLNIRPRVSFRDPDLTIDEAGDSFVLLALDTESQEADWNAVSSLGIEKNRFLFERVCLRSAAAIISLLHIDSENTRLAVEARFWDRMDTYSPKFNPACQVYFQTFNQSSSAKDSRVFAEFSIQCSGSEDPIIVAFAHKEFNLLLLVYRKWLERHGIKS